MKRLRDAVALLGSTMLGGAMLFLVGCADDPAGAGVAATPGNGVCLQRISIDHTQILDDNTILFFMKGGKAWKNTLTFQCPSLKLEDGFAYQTDIPEICSNLQTIRVLRSGNFCELGQFTPYVAPPKPN